MKVAVWDTYVKRDSGLIMHFDVLVPIGIEEADRIYDYANHYLASKSFQVESVQSNKCLFCHIEEASKDIQVVIEQEGYYILELENCS